MESPHKNRHLLETPNDKKNKSNSKATKFISPNANSRSIGNIVGNILLSKTKTFVLET